MNKFFSKQTILLSGSKAEELVNVSQSAWILCIMGLIGIGCCVLISNDIIHLSLESYIYTFFLGILWVLFVFFLSQGIFSFIKIHFLKKECKKEKAEFKRLQEWMNRSFCARQIDQAIGISFSELSPEDIFLLRCSFILQQLLTQNPCLSEPCLESFTEFLCQKIFS